MTEYARQVHMDERKKMTLQPGVMGIPRTWKGPKEDQIIHWVITTLNRSQKPSSLGERRDLVPGTRAVTEERRLG